MMLRLFATPRTGRWRRRGAKPRCCALPEGQRGGFRPSSIRRSASLLSGGCCFGLLVLDHLEKVARPRITSGIIARRIAGRMIRLVGIRAGVEQLANDRRVMLLDRNDQ